MIIVTNKGEIPLSGIRLLGHTDKAADKIGQFGTGLKEAVALCLRMGVEVIIFSGLTRIDFSVQELDGEKEVCFKFTYGAGEEPLSHSFVPLAWHGMGFSPQLGVRDWTEAWQILREVICNARDEGDMRVGRGDVICGSVGKTTVYLGENDALNYELDNIQERLLFLRDEMMGTRDCAISKTVGSACRIYCKGVFVKRTDYPSIFDYNINDLQLTESRSVDWGSVTSGIAKLMQSDPDYWAAVMKEMARQDLVETAYISSWIFDKRKGEGMRLGFYGDRAVPCHDSQMAERLAKKGYIPIKCTESMTRILDSTGVRTEVLAKHYSRGLRVSISESRTDKRFALIWKALSSRWASRVRD